MTFNEATIKNIFGIDPKTPWDKAKPNGKTYVAVGILAAIAITVFLYWWVFAIVGIITLLAWKKLKKQEEHHEDKTSI